MKISHVFCAVAPLLLSIPALAGAQSGGHVEQLTASGRSFKFVASGVRSRVPVCASAAANCWMLDASTSQGQATMASVMTSFASGRKIHIVGIGRCSELESGVEQVMFMVVDK